MALRRAILWAALTALLPWGAVSAPASGDIPKKVVFVAWNVRNYLIDPPRSAEGARTTPPKTEKAAAATADVLAKIAPDILGLSEIGSRRDLADLQRRLEKRGVHLPFSTWVEGADEVRHLALLSRFPISEIQHVTNAVVKTGVVSQRVQRGFLDCTLSVTPHFSLRILGAHLKSRRITPEFDQAEFRRGESMALRNRIESILKKDSKTPLLVFGDFNDVKNSPAVAGLLGRAGGATSLYLVPLADVNGESWTYHWAETDEYSRVDYVMISPALRPLLDRRASRICADPKWSKASDHRPLLVTLRPPPVK